MREVLIGQTDYTVFVKIIGTDGAPETGLAHTDIDIAYARVETDNDVTTSDVSPADLANLSAAHSDWGWEEVSSTDHPGLYRLDIADAVFASGAWEAVVTITDASGTDFYPVDIGFRLIAFNVQDGVRLGLTALPNAAADAAGGLPISDAGGLDLDNRMPAATSITNMNVVYTTDFATNYDTTRDRWQVDTDSLADNSITADALATSAVEEIAAEVGGGGGVMLVPTDAMIPPRRRKKRLVGYVGETITQRVTDVVDLLGDPFDFTAVTCELAIYASDRVTELLSLADGDLNKSVGEFDFEAPDSAHPSEQRGYWSIREVGGEVLVEGPYPIRYAP